MIRYTQRGKYYLEETVTFQLRYIRPEHRIETELFTLDVDGTLEIRHGYPWDGPSGPAKDIKERMQGSLVHDVGYECQRKELLPASSRKLWDREFELICRDDGMNPWRALLDFRILRRFGSFAANPKNRREVLEAP